MRPLREAVSVPPGIVGVLALVLVVWLLYVAVKVAQHVSAWPF